MASSRSLTTATGLTKLLHPHLSPQMTSPFPIRSLRSVARGSRANSDLTTAVDLTKLLRSFCTVSVRSSGDSESNADLSSKNPSIDLKDIGERYQDSMRKKAFEKKLVNDSFYLMRLDLPGVSSDDLKMWVNEKKDVVFEANCRREAKYGYDGGFYSGNIPGCPLLCDMEQLKFEMDDGVVWVTLPLTEDAKRAVKWQRDLLVKPEAQGGGPHQRDYGRKVKTEDARGFSSDTMPTNLVELFIRDPNNKAR
ncbi:uncharacterized protein LOC132304050 [Cornus florida]|uniref:uncharacterized protein LOC132304050 n=1 Tax=Cornus florida TaxID=4283 RepID=UPI0028A20310|nr:uncharacterized protein LOC132304050 [Cornus florida]